VLTAAVKAQKELIPAKRAYSPRRSCYGQRGAIIGNFIGAKDSTAALALAPPPYLVKPLLRAGVDNVGFAATIYTNHVNILS
jgi:hypothetical protein